MNTQFWLVQAFNGVSYGALLFLVGAGLSLIFGVMRIVNLSHGSYFLLGGYVALSVIHATGSWALSLPVAALTIAAVGIAMERLFLRSEGFEFVRNAVLALGLAILVALAIQSWKPRVHPGSPAPPPCQTPPPARIHSRPPAGNKPVAPFVSS